MRLYPQNTCSRDITAFLRVDYHNAEHPNLTKRSPDDSGVPWGYRSIIKDPPETRDGARFHPLTESHPLVGGDYCSDRFKGKAAQTNHISKLPRPPRTDTGGSEWNAGPSEPLPPTPVPRRHELPGVKPRRFRPRPPHLLSSWSGLAHCCPV